MPALPINEMHTLVKRGNFAAREPGVILVFCILGALAILLLSLGLYRWMQKRRAASMQKV